MIKFITAALVACAALSFSAIPAQAAGGRGASFCSNSGAPDGVMVFGEVSTYDNPGEVVSALAPLPGNPGSGWGIQFFCNPNINS